MAPVNLSVVTQPEIKPNVASFSGIFSRGSLKVSRPMERFYVLLPVAKAVPAAAESVVKSSAEAVFRKPMLFNCVRVNAPPLAKAAEEIWLSPFPSPMNNMMFFRSK